jgi:hypothetical protein
MPGGTRESAEPDAARVEWLAPDAEEATRRLTALALHASALAERGAADGATGEHLRTLRATAERAREALAEVVRDEAAAARFAGRNRCG